MTSDMAAVGITFYVVHTILILRLYGLYASKRLAYSLAVLLCLCLAAHAFIVSAYSPTFTVLDLGMGVGKVCVPQDIAKVAFIWCVVVPILY